MRFALLSTAIFLPAAAQAFTEEVVRIPNAEGQEIVGTLTHSPDAHNPVVLMLHGFTGSRDELRTGPVPDGVFGHVAKALAEAGFASLRIDFRGSGESVDDLTFADTTFEGQVADALAAVDWLKQQESVDPGDLYLIGWSQGGLVATAAAGRSGAFDAVALWAAVADPDSVYGAMADAETMARGFAAGPDDIIPITLPWAQIELKGGFFDGIETFEPTEEIAAYAGPLLVAQGSLDTTVPPENADLLIAAHEGPERLWTSEMDHVFNVFTTAETLDALVGETIGFFREHDD